MPSVLDRSALEQSPLADLHLLANELGVDGFRRLRKPDLVDAILSRQSGEEAPAAAAVEEPEADAAGSEAETVEAEEAPKPKRASRKKAADEPAAEAEEDAS
jgi:transcription termination factor Rho